MRMFGRDTELKDLAALVDGPGDRSGILIEGEPGIGKSALVDEAVAAAAIAGLRALRTAGAETEHGLAYAGLQRLLYPLRRGFDALPARQFDALSAALGTSETDGEPSLHLVALAALTLLSDTAAERPLLVVAEDVHWLDPASAEVLAFVARRIDSEPVAVLATLRAGTSSPLRAAGLTLLPLGPLSDDDAAALLGSVARDLPDPVRRRVLAEAHGNPLALTELPTAAADLTDPTSTLPLTERLERAFSARGAALPGRTRAALLVAALDDGDSIIEILSAAKVLLGSEVDAEILEPAVTARLIDIDAGTVTFRHPLIRSALASAAPPVNAGARTGRSPDRSPTSRIGRCGTVRREPTEPTKRWPPRSRRRPSGPSIGVARSPRWNGPRPSATTPRGARIACCAPPNWPSTTAAGTGPNSWSAPRTHSPSPPRRTPPRTGCSAGSRTECAKVLRVSAS
ncbi:AAA family ATPase [Nocardia aurantia]|uniref:Orc1-like AAA ATPase domain-containing protein n=1 Tax=Nocardia aurantia TaxID=2585199 RepID=A0A7K0DWY3_9NOCA|nr:AAA family ATPase [Nocardia aurantia]MQY29822.1 hypothetical protein [Nocardia aurantia]